MRTTRVWWKTAGLWVLILGLALGVGGLFGRPSLAQDDPEFLNFYEVLKKIKDYYVDPAKIDDEKLVEGAIRGLVSSLEDRHSAYLDASQRKELSVETAGAFGGLGIEITVEQGRLLVVSPIEETPAHEAGILSGDHIAAIGGESTEGFSVEQAVKKLRGEVGTNVTITILRQGVEDPFDVTIKRAIIKIQTVKSYMLSNKIGYVRLRSFAEPTAADLDKALKDLQTKEMKGLIVDLRGNPGGLLESAIDVSSKFLEAGKLVVSTKGRLRNMNRQALSKGGPCAVEPPLIVLVNRGSASASEIVTGAMKDHRRGIVVGTKSFGKGSVQSIFELPDNAGLKLTTAYYYTPSGALIHEKGIPPDVQVEEKTWGKAMMQLIPKESFVTFADRHLKQHPEVKLPYHVEDKTWDAFCRHVKEQGLTLTEADLLKERDVVRARIKYDILRQSKGRETAELAALEEEDDVVRRAVELLNVTSVWRKAPEGPKEATPPVSK